MIKTPEWKDKHVIQTVRKWHEPVTQSYITAEGMTREIPLDDFIEALKQEIGSVTFTFTKDTFSKQVDAAVKRVMETL